MPRISPKQEKTKLGNQYQANKGKTPRINFTTQANCKTTLIPGFFKQSSKFIILLGKENSFTNLVRKGIKFPKQIGKENKV